MRRIGLLVLAGLLVSAGIASAQRPPDHASPKGKAPSAATNAKQDVLRESLSGETVRD